MRFVCDSCRAQYNISDDKVGAKGVKVRCKKCGFVIHVRRTEDAAPSDLEATQQVQVQPSDPSAAASSGDAGAENGASGAESSAGEGAAASHNGPAQLENPLFGGMEEDEIGAVFDQVLSSGSHKVGAVADAVNGEEATTRVLDTATLLKLAEESNAGDGGSPSGDAGEESGPPTTDWYVAIEEKQTGPLTLDKLKDHWDAGEIGPESLCWRAGFSDWTPLSELKDLVGVLAPRPAKPVIVAPLQPAPSVMTVPVESAFTAGGVTRTVHADVPVVASAPTASGDEGGWKPSAASALASLVKEEMSVLSKPAAPRKASQAPVLTPASSTPGLLDVPPPESSGPQNILTANMPASDELPPTANIRRPVPVEQFPAYRPPPPVVTPVASKKGMYIAGAVGGGLVILLLGVIAWGLVFKDEPAPAPVVVAKSEPAPVEKAKDPEMPPPPPGMKPIEAQPASATTAAPAPAAVEQPKAEEPAKVAESKPEPKPEREPARIEREPRPARQPTKVAARSRSDDDDDEGEAFTAPSKPERVAAVTGSEDEFDKIFGSDEEEEEKPAKSDRKRTAYIPPAPGSAQLPESLGQSDIMQVVLNHKPAIVGCVNEQRKRDPSLSGKLVMRWTIRTNGRTSGVSVRSSEFKSTYMASCISGLVKSWKFPRHQKQGEPIDFPFTF